jgi:hypothetical protein
VRDVGEDKQQVASGHFALHASFVAVDAAPLQQQHDCKSSQNAHGVARNTTRILLVTRQGDAAQPAIHAVGEVRAAAPWLQQMAYGLASQNLHAFVHGVHCARAVAVVQ